MTSLQWANVLRTFAVAEFIVNVGLCCGVLAYYWRAVRWQHRQAGRVPHAGLLPWHVLTVTVSYLAFAFEGVARSVMRHGLPIQGWTILNVVVLALSIYALVLVLAYERLRVVRHHRPSTEADS